MNLLSIAEIHIVDKKKEGDAVDKEFVRNKYEEYFMSITRETANSDLVYLYKGKKLPSGFEAYEIGQKSYSEIISPIISKYSDKYEWIKPVHRHIGDPSKEKRGLSFANNHIVKAYADKNAHRERILLMKLFAHSKLKNNFRDSIGEILDYEYPLKNDGNVEFGKVDLVSYRNGSIILIEGKTHRNPETLLRTILEIKTYSRLFPATPNEMTSDEHKDTDYFRKIFNEIISDDARVSLKAIPIIVLECTSDGVRSESEEEFLQKRKYEETIALAKITWGIDVLRLIERKPYIPGEQYGEYSIDRIE